MDKVLFQIPPHDATVRKYLRTHVLVRTKSGHIPFPSLFTLSYTQVWRGTLSEWSVNKKTLKVTNAQADEPAMTGLGVACKAFRFDTVMEVAVADASPEVLATLTPTQAEAWKTTAASMARAAAEDARIEQHRDMTELMDQADRTGVSFGELLVQRGLATPVDDEEEDDDDDDEGGKSSKEGKKPRRRGGKKRKDKKKNRLLEVDSNISAQLEEALDQAVAANSAAEKATVKKTATALAKPRARVIVELRAADAQPIAHILPAKTTRGHGPINGFLLNGVGPILVGPKGQALPPLDAQVHVDGRATTYRCIASAMQQDHADQIDAQMASMGLPPEARERVANLIAEAPAGATEMDPDLARVIRGLEDGSMGWSSC